MIAVLSSSSEGAVGGDEDGASQRWVLLLLLLLSHSSSSSPGEHCLFPGLHGHFSLASAPQALLSVVCLGLMWSLGTRSQQESSATMRDGTYG